MKSTFLAIVACALLLFGIAAPGHAAFTTGDLIQVVYDTQTGDEVGTDLGSLSSILSSGGETFTANPVTLTQLGVTSFSALGNTYTTGINTGVAVGGVAYYVWSGTNQTLSTTYLVVAASSTLSSLTSAGSFSAGKTAMVNANNTYIGAAGGTSQAVIATSNAKSYWNGLDINGATGSIGSYSGWLSTANGQNFYGGEVVPVDYGSVTQTLYQWAGGTSGVGGLGTPIGTITTETLNVGSQEVLEAVFTPEAAPVPLPPSVLLMAPGLFGLIGLSRRIRRS
jgi:hypothetical protein